MSAHADAILAAALIDLSAWRTVTTTLRASDFASPDDRALFSALRTMTPQGNGVDVLGIRAALRKAGREDLADHVTYLLDEIPSVAPLPNWIATLREESRRRALLAALEQARAELTTGSDPVAVEKALDATLSAIRASAPDGRVFDDKRAMAQAALDYLLDDSRSGTPYGFAPWDAAVLPAQQGHLILLAGASSAGKSMVARNVLRQHVQRYEKRTGWLTCEMTGEEQLAHLACADADLSIEDYYRKRLTVTKADAFRRNLEWWRDTDLLRVNELGQVTPSDALHIFRRWREEGVTHFVLDHLHRLDYGASKSGDDLRIPIANFARQLKTFAKDTQSLVVALVQYSKIKPHDEPSDDKIREANNILEESDAAFHIYRPLVACERDKDGALHPIAKPGSLVPYFEHEAPKGSTLAHDPTAVYVKLGKQRRRLRDGLIRIPFNKQTGVMYDTMRLESRRPA